MPKKIRIAVISTPRTGNTWLTMMLARFYEVPRAALHELTEEAWQRLPDELVLQIHWRWDAGLMARLEREGFRVITLARHPFDVLISILHVVVYDVESERWLLGAGGDERSIWAATPRSRNFVAYCKGPRAFELLSVTCDYWHRPDVMSLRYEDLVADTRAVLKQVEERFGPRRTADVESMLQDLSLGELRKTATTNHFWKGQPGLWRKFLPPREAAEIGHALGPIFRTLDYAVDPDPDTDADTADAAWNQAAGEDMGTTIRRLRAESRSWLLRVGELEAHAQALSVAVAERDNRVSELAGQVGSRDEQVAALSGQVRSREEEVAALARQLRIQDQHLRQLTEQRADLQNRSEALTSQVSELESQLRARLEHAQRLTDELEAERNHHLTSTLFVDTGGGYGSGDRRLQRLPAGPGRFRIGFAVGRRGVRGVRWDPLELRTCRVRVDRVEWEDAGGRAHRVDPAVALTNGRAAGGGAVVFDTLDPMMVLPVAGDVARVTVEGWYEADDLPTSLATVTSGRVSAADVQTPMTPLRPVFAPPRHVHDISDCYFYHVMDVPGHGVVGGQWDLRGGEASYLGSVNLRGKRVLELGTASGYLCRYMESQGAEMIGFDLAADRSWDHVPYAGLDLTEFEPHMRRVIEKLKNGWWFAHRLFGSRAKAVYGNIYDIPKEIGPVDVATFGAILLHLRDPFQALHSVLQLTREQVIVTELHPEQPDGSALGSIVPAGTTGSGHPGCLYFQPQPGETNPHASVTWWVFPPAAICRFLGVLGFEHHTVTEHEQTFMKKKARMYTVVANRTRPL